MRQILTALSPRLNISQARLLDEFDRLFPEPALSAIAESALQSPREQPQLRFQHECE